MNADRNLSRVNTRVKQLTSQAFREVAANPDSLNAVRYLRNVAKNLHNMAAGVPLTKSAIKSEDWSEATDRFLDRMARSVEAGFDYAPVKYVDDDRLQKLASTQIRNTVARPVNFLKPIKDALNAPTPKWNEAAERLEYMATSLEIGVQLASGNVRAAKRRVSELNEAGYVPTSVVRHVLQ